MSGPLHGIKVLDVTTSLSGPLAAGILADLGADVIKIERASAPDRARFSGTRQGDISAMFHMANRGKRSITLDLREPADLETAHALARDADVFVENFRVGVTKRLGIDYATLSALNERLIYVSVNGFGSTGPYADRPAFDSLLQAYGGIAALQANDRGEPQLVGHAVVDKVTGLIGAQAALSALFARERGAGGQHIEVSMLEAAAWFSFLDTAGSTILPDAPRPAGSDDATSGKRITVRFADGWGMLSLGHDDSFRGTCEIFEVDLDGKQHLLTMQGRDADRLGYEAVLEQFRAKAASLPLTPTAHKLLAAGAMFAEVLEPAQIPANEQAVARRLHRIAAPSRGPDRGTTTPRGLLRDSARRPAAKPGPWPAQRRGPVRAPAA